MKTTRRLTALVACSLAATTFAAPPPLSVTTSDSPSRLMAADYPLTCSALSKPLVFKAWEALANARLDEARETLDLALVADPKCVMARASLGAITPGAKGTALFASAMGNLSRVSQVERLDLQAMQASRDGELSKALGLAQKLVDLAPNVLMVNLHLAHHALALEAWEDAATAAQKATELSPSNGAGWNLLGYARLRAHRTAEAIEAFRKYVEVAPQEPNAHDSLGDALLADNQLDAAATEYQRAIDGSAGKFWVAWSGLATLKAIQGDWAGARAALEGMKAGAIEPTDKFEADAMTAWSWAAQGRLTDALKSVDLAQKEGLSKRLEAAVARATLLRGQLNLAGGRYAAAVKSFREADKLQVGQLAPAVRKRYRGEVLSGLTAAQARLGKLPDAARSLARLDEYAKANLSGPFALDSTGYARGVLALAQGDARAAVQALSKCSEPDALCQMTLAEARQEAGETAAAAAAREDLVRANLRDPEYWFVHTRLEARMRESSM